MSDFAKQKAQKYKLIRAMQTRRYLDACLLQKYYILYAEGKHLLANIHEGKLYHQGIEYQVVYYTDLTRGKILNNLTHQYACSFRVAIDPTIKPIVLIWEAAR